MPCIIPKYNACKILATQNGKDFSNIFKVSPLKINSSTKGAKSMVYTMEKKVGLYIPKLSITSP